MTRALWIAWFAGVSALAQPAVLRQGISVEMAVTSSASPMREADQAGSQIVAVTRSGAAYLEVTQVTPTALSDALRAPRSAQVFVKADARASYANVSAALAAIRAAGIDGVNLLTSQRDAGDGASVPPKGIRVAFGAPRDSDRKAVGLDAAGPMLFGDVMRIIDASHSAGVAVFLR